MDVPIKKEISLILLEPEPISIVICVPLINIFTRNYEDFFLFGKDIYSNKSLLELEEESDIWLNKTLDGIYIEFQSEKLK